MPGKDSLNSRKRKRDDTKQPDRFIPRPLTPLEKERVTFSPPEHVPTAYTNALTHTLFGLNADTLEKRKCLPIGQKTTPLTERSSEPSKTSSTPNAKRSLNRIGEFETGNIISDFYANIISYKDKQLIMATEDALYSMNVTTKKSFNYECDETIYATSICYGGKKFITGASHKVKLYDFGRSEAVSTYDISSTCYKICQADAHINYLGHASGEFSLLDTRKADIETSYTHGMERVCGLLFKDNYLLSSANDKVVKVWDIREMDSPCLSFSAHTAGVKAMAFLPNKPGVVASGGGTTDQRIIIWNYRTGGKISEIDTREQVCGLHWLDAHHLVSAHGFSSNSVRLWQKDEYSGLTQIQSEKRHGARVLYSAQDVKEPRKVFTASPPIDDRDIPGTLMFWEMGEDPKKKEREEFLSSKTARWDTIR